MVRAGVRIKAASLCRTEAAGGKARVGRGAATATMTCLYSMKMQTCSYPARACGRVSAIAAFKRADAEASVGCDYFRTLTASVRRQVRAVSAKPKSSEPHGVRCERTVCSWGE